MVEKWLIKAVLAVSKSLDEPIRTIYERSRDVARSCIPYLNVQETAYLAEAAVQMARKAKSWKKIGRDVDLTRPCFMHDMEKAANAMDRRLQTKAKAVRLEATRASGSVFYLSSWHQTPAEGHRDLQGKLYVDRFWRDRLERSGNEFLIPAVQNIVRERSLLTIQEVTGAPYWLIFRPYCRHYLVPVGTAEVLGSTSEKDIRRNHPEAHMPVHRTMTEQQRRQAYIRRRARIRSRIKGSPR